MMPTVAGEAFREFLSRIELNPTRVALASQRYAHVKRIIENAITGASVRQIGSFRKYTKIRPCDLGDGLDLDVLVSLYSAREYARAGEGANSGDALARVYQAVRSSETFRAMEPERDAPVVVLEYADDFKVELVPAVEDGTGNKAHADGTSACWVPQPGGGWMTADYEYDANYISRLNQSDELAGALVPTIKLFKAFAREHSLPLKSFHVEVLAALALPPRVSEWNCARNAWDLPHAFAATLEDCGLHMRGPVALPGSHSPPTDSGLGAELQDVGEYLRRAGATAWKLCMDGSEARALNGWLEIFGDRFPAAANFV
jgi:Second Messenger Oligonucleotide or Dinucleotide Synthetase domain